MHTPKTTNQRKMKCFPTMFTIDYGSCWWPRCFRLCFLFLSFGFYTLGFSFSISSFSLDFRILILLTFLVPNRKTQIWNLKMTPQCRSFKSQVRNVVATHCHHNPCSFKMWSVWNLYIMHMSMFTLHIHVLNETENYQVQNMQWPLG